MTDLYARFAAATAQASHNAAIIFLGTLLALAAWHSIQWLPQRWQTYARLTAWTWVMVFLAGTILYSL